MLIQRPATAPTILLRPWWKNSANTPVNVFIMGLPVWIMEMNDAKAER